MLLLYMSDIWICILIMFILLQDRLIMKTVCNDINVFTIVTRLCGWWHPAADDGGVICCNPFVPTKLLDFTVPTCSFHWASLAHSAAVFLSSPSTFLLFPPSSKPSFPLLSCFSNLLLSCLGSVLFSPLGKPRFPLPSSPHQTSLVFHSSAVSVALARHSPSNNG